MRTGMTERSHACDICYEVMTSTLNNGCYQGTPTDCYGDIFYTYLEVRTDNGTTLIYETFSTLTDEWF